MEDYEVKDCMGERLFTFCIRYQDNKDIPLLVLANKQDLPSALGGPDVSQVIRIWQFLSFVV